MAALDPPVGELIIPADTTVKGPCCGALGLRISEIALAGVAQWIECQPVNQRVTGSIPSQGTCLGCRPGPQYGVCERQPDIDVSLPLFLLPFLSL